MRYDVLCCEVMVYERPRMKQNPNPKSISKATLFVIQCSLSLARFRAAFTACMQIFPCENLPLFLYPSSLPQ